MADVPISYFKAVRSSGKFQPSNPPDLENPPPVINPPGSGGGSVVNAGIGIFLNGKVIGGVKRLIQSVDVLVIPLYWQYNIHGVSLGVDGVIVNDGEINIG